MSKHRKLDPKDPASMRRAFASEINNPKQSRERTRALAKWKHKFNTGTLTPTEALKCSIDLMTDFAPRQRGDSALAQH